MYKNNFTVSTATRIIYLDQSISKNKQNRNERISVKCAAFTQTETQCLLRNVFIDVNIDAFHEAMHEVRTKLPMETLMQNICSKIASSFLCYRLMLRYRDTSDLCFCGMSDMFHIFCHRHQNIYIESFSIPLIS